MPLRLAYPTTPGAENIAGSFAALNTIPAIYWPNDCHSPGCGARMRFAYDPITEGISRRVCPRCGATAHCEVVHGRRMSCRILLSPF